MKKVYIEPVWKLHSGYHVGELIPYPPEGYEFIVNEGPVESMSNRISKLGFSYRLMGEMYRIAPLTLIKSYLERFLRKAPEGTDLTFSSHHLIFRKEPWVIEIDAPWDCIGPNTRYFKKYKGIVEHAFGSEYCKKILCWSEYSKKEVLTTLNCAQFEQKIEVLPCAVHRKNFVKSSNADKVRLLFVGSANAAGEFEMRGGKEVLEAFNILSQRYKNLELVVRSDIPRHLKKKYWKCLGSPNVRLIDKIIPFTELEQIYQSADIFLFPGHYDNMLNILEAMSYELPVIATDVYATSERVEDARTGLLITRSDRVPYHQEGIPFLNLTPRFRRAIQIVDPHVVEELVEKISILIEDGGMRQRMGKAGRWEVEHGKFSIEHRNEVLKRVFDEATA